MLVAVAAIGACASLGMGTFQEPIVTFKDLKVRGLGISGGTLDAYVNVYNPNGFRLDATRLTYNVLVGQNQLGTGALDSVVDGRVTIGTADDVPAAVAAIRLAKIVDPDGLRRDYLLDYQLADLALGRQVYCLVPRVVEKTTNLPTIIGIDNAGENVQAFLCSEA